MKKIKIAFMAPEGKGGPYFIYHDFVDGLNKKYSNIFEAYFFNTKKDWLKLHFVKYDFIFSVIPFLFKPIRTKNFFISLYGNYNIEKRKNSIGNKLLYLMDYNLYFVDKILLSNLFLVDKVKNLKKYENKFFILPNPIDTQLYSLKNKILKKEIGNDYIDLLTVSSTKFFEKGMGIVDLGNKIKNIDNININWVIVAGGNDENREKIEKEFYQINFPTNIKITWLGWLSKNELDIYYKKSDVFIYGTRLEVWGQTIMEAMAYGLPIILLDYEGWKYTYPKEIITNDVVNSLNMVLDDYEYYSKLSIDFVKNYDKNIVLENLYEFIINY